MSQEPKSPAPFSEVGGEALKPTSFDEKCPYCVASQKHALRHNPEVEGNPQLGFVRCMPHRLLQPVTQYLSQFAREATEVEKHSLPNILLEDAIAEENEKDESQPEYEDAIIALRKEYPTQYESGAFFGQNPLTLLSKACEVEWDAYALAPTDATLWGTVIAYLPLSLKGEKARGWTFYVLLSAAYERGEYENRHLGVAFSVQDHTWGYLPDPHVALALASCV